LSAIASPEPPNSAGKSSGLGRLRVCGSLLADRGLRATLLPRRLEVWLLVQNHLKRNPASHVVIDWMRGLFDELAAN
jgi:hypothetical protein